MLSMARVYFLPQALFPGYLPPNIQGRNFTVSGGMRAVECKVIETDPADIGGCKDDIGGCKEQLA